MNDLVLYALAGFAAQLIDGTLGMAYGITASSLLLGTGLPPATISATVHAAECFATGTSALSHHVFGNIDKKLFRALIVPGVIGAILGAYILSSLPGDKIKPFIALYLMGLGVVIIVKAFRQFPPKSVTKHIKPLGFFGAFIDTIGGGGWGPIVASTLVARGNDVRKSVGTVNAVEFFVTLAASITFLFTIGFDHWDIIAALAVGGVIAAPIGAWACKRVPVKPFMIAVGALVIVIGIYNIIKSLS